jgi:hypothetical protein
MVIEGSIWLLLEHILAGNGWIGLLFCSPMGARSTWSRQRPGEALLDKCVVSTVTFKDGGIMVLGAMSYQGPGILKVVHGILNSQGYIDILSNCAIPSPHLLVYRDEFWYQDDGSHITGPR